MEKQLFTWEEFDQQDTIAFIFYNCILIKDIASYKKDTHFGVIDVDYEKGKITFYNNETGEKESIYELSLQVGKKLNE